MPDFERKLTTILAADVVAFSDMMGRNETGTLRALKQYRDLIESCIGERRGRVFGGAGDSLIARFSSPLSAVHCANDFQERIADLNHDSPEPQRMWFRVGINLGDVTIDGDNPYGDGVNIAVRLEQEGARGICISHKVHSEVHRNLDMSFSDGGVHTLKNIDQPVGVSRVRTPSQDSGVHPSDRKMIRTDEHPVLAKNRARPTRRLLFATSRLPAATMPRFLPRDFGRDWSTA